MSTATENMELKAQSSSTPNATASAEPATEASKKSSENTAKVSSFESSLSDLGMVLRTILLDQTYSDHRKLTLASFALFFLIGMLFMG